mmetsp:Transcript_12593/g.18099  ORF Transcript_12593/g.18099 Transcript_12593/m.18099 type:complete len:129 (+) Transcript_12593:654-1040(+)
MFDVNLNVCFGWHAEIVHVETVFLYSDMENEVYMKMPPGFKEAVDEKVVLDECLLLEKSIYGLVQAAHQYWKKFMKTAEDELGFGSFWQTHTCCIDKIIKAQSLFAFTLMIALWLETKQLLFRQNKIL